jgi:hypothetical protein
MKVNCSLLSNKHWLLTLEALLNYAADSAGWYIRFAFALPRGGQIVNFVLMIIHVFDGMDLIRLFDNLPAGHNTGRLRIITY